MPLAGELRRTRLWMLAAIVLGALALPSAAAAADLGLPVGLPIELTQPSIAGVIEQGQTVTCSTGTWLGDPTSYAYTWQRDATDIAGATGSTYTLAAADVGHAVTCAVTAANALGISALAISLPILPVSPPGVPGLLTVPAIAGSPLVGQTVTCSQGTWSGDPTTYVYSWQRSGATIPGATAAAYTLTTGDVGQAITCAVSAVNSIGATLPVPSLPIVPLAPSSLPVPVATGLPAISGNPALGQTLTCSSGSWSNNPSGFAYAWERAGAILSGATGSTYVLTASDLTQAIACVVVARNASGNSAPLFSLPVVPAAAGSGGKGGGKPGGGGKPAKLLAPIVKSLSVSPHKLTITVKGKRQTTRGATFHFAIDKKAGVLIYVERRTVGRVSGRSCAKVTKRNKHGRHCTRYVRIKSFTVKNAKAGAHTLKYGGRLGRGLVASGNYTVFAAAQNAAGWSRLRSANFTVARKVVKVRARRPSKHRT